MSEIDRAFFFGRFVFLLILSQEDVYQNVILLKDSMGIKLTGDVMNAVQLAMVTL